MGDLVVISCVSRGSQQGKQVVSTEWCPASNPLWVGPGACLYPSHTHLNGGGELKRDLVFNTLVFISPSERGSQTVALVVSSCVFCGSQQGKLVVSTVLCPA